MINYKQHKISTPDGLMLGNLHINKHGEIAELVINDFLRWGGLKMDNDYGIYAIPLSPAVLEACGFRKDGWESYNKSIHPFVSHTHRTMSFSGDYLFLKEGTREYFGLDEIVTIWNKDLMKEFYLHQLQNIWLLTMQKPLEIDIEKLKIAVI